MSVHGPWSPWLSYCSGGEVARRRDGRHAPGLAPPHLTGRAEVQQHRRFVRPAHVDVRGLHVAVQEASRVDVAQPVRHRQHHPLQLRLRERSQASEQTIQRLHPRSPSRCRRCCWPRNSPAPAPRWDARTAPALWPPPGTGSSPTRSPRGHRRHGSCRAGTRPAASVCGLDSLARRYGLAVWGDSTQYETTKGGSRSLQLPTNRTNTHIATPTITEVFARIAHPLHPLYAFAARQIPIAAITEYASKVALRIR